MQWGGNSQMWACTAPCLRQNPGVASAGTEHLSVVLGDLKPMAEIHVL